MKLQLGIQSLKPTGSLARDIYKKEYNKPKGPGFEYGQAKLFLIFSPAIDTSLPTLYELSAIYIVYPKVNYFGQHEHAF